MSRTPVDQIAHAVLYEGYVLYPYRPSVKNRLRWTFGGLYPESYCLRQAASDASTSQTECLVLGRPETTLDVRVRFLHLTERLVGELAAAKADASPHLERPIRVVEELRIGEQVWRPWQEAEEREIELAGVSLVELEARPRRQPFAILGRRWSEPLWDRDGKAVGVLLREQQSLEGVIEAEAARVREGLYRLTVRVANLTPLDDAPPASRDDALRRSLLSAHTIVGVRRGEFVSLLDPPEACRAAAAACRNVGTWPVLVGAEDQRDTILSAPIILYDFPRVAPESPGDLFDGTEIDEILTLRILTLTDQEKQEAAAVDERVRDLLRRTEALAEQELLRLHGTVRTLRPLAGGDS